MSIAQYVQNAGKLARTNRFLFHIPLPPIQGHTFNEDFWLNCYSITMPGQELITENVDIHSWFTKAFAVGKKFPEFQASFYVSEDHAERNIFVAWQNIAVGDDNVLRFRNSYITDAIIYQLTTDVQAKDGSEVSLENGSISGISLKGVFPTRVGEIRYSYDSSNQVATCDVTFSAYSWKPMRAQEKNMSLPKRESPKQTTTINPDEIIWNS